MMRPHRLSDYVTALGANVVTRSGLDDLDDPVITQVTYDSREVRPGALFICKGAHFRSEYLRQAITAGAVAYLSQQVYEFDDASVRLPYILVSDMREAIATAGTAFYDREWDRLTLIGITGTKGKSTTTIFLQSILAQWMASQGKPRPGIMSSIRYEDGVEATASVKTTPETLELYGHLHNAVTAGLTQMCVEVSSQGLKYRRVANLTFEVAGFLNVSEDHISPSEHEDYADYLAAKLMIFTQARQAVVNARTQEREAVMAAAAQCERVVTFSADTDTVADVVGRDIAAVGSGQEFSVELDGVAHRFAIQMAGAFNVENAVAAIAIAWVMGVPVEHMRNGLARARVPGRMEVFHDAKGTTVIVDYAHQRLSVETLLDTVHSGYPDSPITMVFGAGGNKGLNRREELGVLAGRHADQIYLTEDDPGDVPIEEICADLNRHIESVGHAPGRVVRDRPAAIEQAIANAAPNGVVLVMGKGSEKWQLRGSTAVKVASDIETVCGLVEANAE
ncbi:MAG: UDP-N-acetylmuramyl-tripeptide synthetase [Propionibacteriaceae bacterium]|nr:UDP-N-acetylmuramyl-tripeptide synthetase [Propionibacteriaceae bacterium]